MQAHAALHSPVCLHIDVKSMCLLQGGLTKKQQKRLLVRWMMSSVDRGAEGGLSSALMMLRREGVELPGLEGSDRIPREMVMGLAL